MKSIDKNKMLILVAENLMREVIDARVVFMYFSCLVKSISLSFNSFLLIRTLITEVIPNSRFRIINSNMDIFELVHYELSNNAYIFSVSRLLLRETDAKYFTFYF